MFELQNITENKEKTYYIRKVGGGGQARLRKKKSECWSLFHVPPPPWLTAEDSVTTTPRTSSFKPSLFHGVQSGPQPYLAIPPIFGNHDSVSQEARYHPGPPQLLVGSRLCLSYPSSVLSLP